MARIEPEQTGVHVRKFQASATFSLQDVSDLIDQPIFFVDQAIAIQHVHFRIDCGTGELKRLCDYGHGLRRREYQKGRTQEKLTASGRTVLARFSPS